jgi:putative transcriptional regulator
MNAEKDQLKKEIAGEIVLSENPGSIIRKWRTIFKIPQKMLAAKINVAPSVISDYESNRRKSPGANIIRKIVNALVDIGFESVKEFPKSKEVEFSGSIAKAIIDMREFLEPVEIKNFCKAIKCEIINQGNKDKIYGYTVIDSISAIINLPPKELVKIYGSNPERALIFTKVTTGRSPMVAIKVTPPKPSLIVLHGLEKVDPVAIEIAKTENIWLAVSKEDSVEKIIEDLKKNFS